MRVLLVSSYTVAGCSRPSVPPPLTVITLAAYYRMHGHEPHIINLDMLPVPSGQERLVVYKQHVLDLLCAEHFDILGFSCLLSEQFPFVRDLAQNVRDKGHTLPILLGGVHATIFSKEILTNCSQFDVIIRGEGEKQSLACAEAFAHSRTPNLCEVDGIAFRNAQGEVEITSRKAYVDINSLPMPAWDMLFLEQYFACHDTWYNPKNLDIKMSVPITTSRGCPYSCSFCSAFHNHGRQLRFRNVSLVVDEMEMLYDKHGINYFGFVDDNITLNKSHIVSLCEEIICRKMNIQFESYTGYNIAALDQEIVHAMAQAGCVYAPMPIEHGSSHMRNVVMGKNLPDEKIYEVAALWKKYDIVTRGLFIMGFPEETRDTLQMTLDMIEKLDLDMYNVYNLIPFPGTKVFNQALRDNLLVEEVEVGKLWEGTFAMDAVNDSFALHSFYLKPYELDFDVLLEYRNIFDTLRIQSTRMKKLNAQKCI